MSMSPQETAATVPTPGPSLGERMVQVFVRPASAWSGLEERAQWWFPLLLVLVLQVATGLLTFHRVIVPMMMDQWDEAIANGQMQPEQVDKVSDFFQHNPMAMLVGIGPQVILLPLFMLIVALVVWFGVGFVLGAKFRYRLALEVTCWASLVRIPETILLTAIGWSTRTFKGIHFGLAALLPEADPPTRVHTGLTVLLDAVGPFGIWYLVVAVLGCSALSGAARKNVAWVLVALYLALAAISAVVAAVLTPAA